MKLEANVFYRLSYGSYAAISKKYLCVKWVIVKQVSTVEDLAVGLVQSDHILLAFEYLDLCSLINICINICTASGDGDLVCDLRATPPEGSLPPDADHGPRAVLYGHGLVIIRVAEDDVGE